MTEIPVISGAAVFEAVDAATAVARTRHAFERHAAGEWEMPSKVYVESPPGGDFRAMPARGDGLAILKWVTSFPGNSARGLPVVRGAILVSDAATGEELALIECASVTSLRTGGAAAVSAQVLAREDAEGVGVVGCGVNGAWAARCLAAVGYESGICNDTRPEVAEELADELGWRAGTREEAVAQDVVVTVTPGHEAVIRAADLRPGQHLAMLGADAAGKAEAELDAIRRCRLYCDEWKQASAGGELAHAFEADAVSRRDVTQIGDVLSGSISVRREDDEITLFDSTGLAIQDLAIVGAVYDAWRNDGIDAPVVKL
jgi:ornithine cyclodeaminase/alanine dehydrogenase-like protein (mu-crystallin family)